MLYHLSSPRRCSRVARFLLWCFVVLSLSSSPPSSLPLFSSNNNSHVLVSAWEWSDLMGGSSSTIDWDTKTLTMAQVREMRPRDIQRRLKRQHGFSAEEVARMIDKKDLIQALSFEEHKQREKEKAEIKRVLVIRGIITAILVIVVLAGWPVWTHLLEVASVNFVVYTDKKKYEASRCWELKSKAGMFGVLLMGIFDALQIWLSASVMLSWVMTSPYFFPVPSLPIRPAQFMGGQIASGPMSRYGMNVGPMVVTWVMRFVYARIEAWTGRALAKAHRAQRKEAKQWESEEDRAARKAARKAAKKAAREEAEQAAAEEEAKRRREAADQATKALFPDRPPPSQSEGDQKQNPWAESQSNDAQKEFQEQLDKFDADDLD